MRDCKGALLLLALTLGCGDDGDPPGEESSTGGTTAPATSPSGTAPTSADASGSSAPTSSTGTTPPPTSSTTTGPDETSTTGNGVEGTLTIYWIDTEGGAATLLVTPEGPLILVDAGNPGDRDPDRIADVIQNEVGTDTLDIMLTTHYDADHVGGVPGVAERLTIGEYWDHGELIEGCGGSCQQLYDDYVAVADGNRTTIAAGDVRSVGGIELHFVSAAGELITEALGSGEKNSACEGAENMPEQSNENALSTGFVARFGDFDFLDLGDLYWFQEHELACPNNLIGSVDIYQTTHHGLASSGATQLVHAVAPSAVVMNNGATKGGAPEAFDTIFAAPGPPDLWQQHLAVDNDGAHNSEEDLIANLIDGGGDEANWIRATIDGPTGTITLHNARNAHERTY